MYLKVKLVSWYCRLLMNQIPQTWIEKPLEAWGVELQSRGYMQFVHRFEGWSHSEVSKLRMQVHCTLNWESLPNSVRVGLETGGKKEESSPSTGWNWSSQSNTTCKSIRNGAEAISSTASAVFCILSLDEDEFSTVESDDVLKVGHARVITCCKNTCDLGRPCECCVLWGWESEDPSK